tara:strand:+ start:1094 stop:1474 length:381 start_codon:yes stop_codon:yes gene_type:complete
MLTGTHSCNVDDIYGDWRIDNKNYILFLETVRPHLINCKKEIIKFDMIGWKGKNIDFQLSKERYNNCNIKIPGIITEGQNPYQLKYRMIDGKHRISKMIDIGLKENYFYILDYTTFIKLLQPILPL